MMRFLVRALVIGEIKKALPVLDYQVASIRVIAIDCSPEEIAQLDLYFSTKIERVIGALHTLTGVDVGSIKITCLIVGLLAKTELLSNVMRKTISPPFGGGCWNSNGDYLVAQFNAQVAISRVISHELAHGFVHKVFPKSALPYFISEGMACWTECWAQGIGASRNDLGKSPYAGTGLDGRLTAEEVISLPEICLKESYLGNRRFPTSAIDHYRFARLALWLVSFLLEVESITFGGSTFLLTDAIKRSGKNGLDSVLNMCSHIYAISRSELDSRFISYCTV